LRIVVRCQKQQDPKDQESSNFTNNLRRGFTPSRQKPTASKGGLDLGGKVVLGNDMSEETWREIDKKVNKYPGQRTFTAIGTGGDLFKSSMVEAVSSVVGTVHQECISERPSSKGSYVSVRIGPVWVQNSDQVVQIFANMKKDERLKWFM